MDSYIVWIHYFHRLNHTVVTCTGVGHIDPPPLVSGVTLQHVPESDVPERDVSLRATLIKIGPQMERDVRDRIKRHLKLDGNPP